MSVHGHIRRLDVSDRASAVGSRSAGIFAHILLTAINVKPSLDGVLTEAEHVTCS